MPTQQCYDNIAKKGGVYCNTLEKNFCADIQVDINEYCQHAGLNNDVPVPQKYNGQKCYCCCSCFAYDTPIEVSPGEFKFIQDIEVGQQVLATGADGKNWAEADVTILGGLAPGVVMNFMYYTAFELDNDKKDQRHIICTADHLFLLPDGTLQAIQDLAPGDEVMAAGDHKAKVIFAVPGQYDRGVRHIGLGDWEKGDSLDGHLLNSNDLITADLSVQLNYYGSNIQPELLAAVAPDRVDPGSPAYIAKYPVAEMMEFVGNKDAWPKGFVPSLKPLINIPEGAKRYFTEKQSESIDKNTKQLDYGNSAPIATAQYLIKLYNAFYGEINFVIDWNRELPNAYYFVDFGTEFIVLTGGLLRNFDIDRDGIAIILSHLIAVKEGHTCVGVADYYATFIYLREVWNDDLYFDVYDDGFAQINKLFDAIDDKEGNPADHCGEPSIACRIDAMERGTSMSGVPNCAKQQPEFFVVSAEASKDLKTVKAVFNKKLDAPSAKTEENYAISSGVKITKAYYSMFWPKQVVLSVTGLKAEERYELNIKDLLDEDLQVISDDGNTINFQTNK